MQCPGCQHTNPSRAEFCEQCGARLGRVCSNCGGQLAPTVKFCPECGRSVSESFSPRRASPDAYTPKHLAEKILTSKSALEGERKRVTVLFADLRSSLELLVERDPEDARKLLDPVLERMMEAVHRYEGTVNQVMGDGIMALFGAPLAHEDHAVRACYAALRMQESVKRYAENVRRLHGIEPQIRVGLNSGEVVVRAIGSDLRMDYSAVGQTTHLAARMEQMAEPGSILATADTFGLVEGYVEAVPLGPRSIRGLQAVVEVYLVTGTGIARWPMEVAAARGLTSFVGREEELAQLDAAMQTAARGHGRVVGLVGEPGVGKSRLFYEKSTAYRPVIDLLRGYFDVYERENQQEVRDKVVGRVMALDPELAGIVPALLSLLDVPVDDPEWQALDPRLRREQTMSAVRRLVLRESQAQPLCVVFEDLQWIDSETQALLDSFVLHIADASVLLLVSYRPDYRHSWASTSYYTQLSVHPLARQEAEALLRTMLGDERQVEPLKQLLIEQTRGNPFFLEESVRMKIEDGALVGERGDYRLMKPIETLRVPASVEAVLAARIDRLAPRDKALLQAASVIGENVPVALLQTVADMPEDQLRDALARLRAAEFLYDISLLQEPHYVFKHGLTRRVAYNSLLREQQRRVHARIVEALEQLYSERLSEQVERLARHALDAELWDKAAPYLRQAATKAFARSANREAVVWFDRLGSCASRPSIFGSTFATLSSRLASSGPSSSASTRRRRWPPRSPTGRGWDGSSRI